MPPDKVVECVEAYRRLRPAATAYISASLHPSTDPSVTQDQAQADHLVARFRWLREAITSCRLRNDLAVEVYEMSVDLCAAAGNYPELLKCLQQLVNVLYTQQRTTDAHRQQHRWLIYAAFALYFACIPSAPAWIDVWLAVWRWPADMHTCALGAQALSACRAISAMDFRNYFKCMAEAPWLLRILLRARLQEVREGAIRRMAKSYRSMSVSSLAQALQLDANAARIKVDGKPVIVPLDLPTQDLLVLLLETAGNKGCAKAASAAATAKAQPDAVEVQFR